jgi:hypothetical protein
VGTSFLLKRTKIRAATQNVAAQESGGHVWIREMIISAAASRKAGVLVCA